jgi:CheY-like chemotaxis protein
MSAQFFKGFRILVVEDELLVGLALCQSLREVGAIILGPASSVGEALDLLNATVEVDGAVLDVNLDGEMVYPVAEKLAIRGVPFVFATAYQREQHPVPFGSIPHCQKPVDASKVADALGSAIARFLSPTEVKRRAMGLID